MLKKYEVRGSRKDISHPIQKIRDGVVKSLNRKEFVEYPTKNNDHVYELLTKNLKLRLKFLGLSMNKVALKNGFSRANVFQWLKSPRLKSVVALANMVGVPVHMLISPDFDPEEYSVNEVLDKVNNE